MSKLLDRAEALHLKTGMHWREAERLALSEIGVDDAAITELVGECTTLGIESLLTGDEISDFARAVLVHGSALQVSMSASGQADMRELLRFDHSIGADRFTVRRGSFWWHVRIGGSTSNVGKFHTKLAAEDMALKMLTAYRDGAFEQYQAARAHAAPAQRQPLPPGLRLAAAFTRADLGPDGSNYPHVRELLAFAEQALGITAAPEAQKGEKL